MRIANHSGACSGCYVQAFEGLKVKRLSSIDRQWWLYYLFVVTLFVEHLPSFLTRENTLLGKSRDTVVFWAPRRASPPRIVCGKASIRCRFR